MRYAKFSLQVYILFLLIGCRTSFLAPRQEKVEKLQFEKFVNSGGADSALKSYLLDIGRWEDLRKLNSTLTKGDIPTVKFIHTLVYEIDSIHLFSFNVRNSIESILNLNKSNIVSFVLKRDSIEAVIYATVVNNRWKGDGCSVPTRGISQKIESIYKSGWRSF